VAITVARGVLSRIRENPGSILIQVLKSSDPQAAAEALERARSDIANLDGGPDSAPGLSGGDANNPSYIGDVVPAGSGPCLYIDGGYTPYRLLRTIPDVIARHLAAAGVHDAVINTAAQGGPMLDLFSTPVAEGAPPHQSVLLCLLPPPPPSRQQAVAMPSNWIDVAVDWVGEGLDDHTELLAQMSPAIEFGVPLSQASAFLRQGQRAHSFTSVLVSRDLTTHIRGANGSFYGGVPTMTLAAAGANIADATLLDEFARLQQVAEGLADQVAYAFISFMPYLGTFAGSGIRGADEYSRPHGEQADLMKFHCDRLVLDAFPYQIIGPGHLDRLGGPPPGARPLAGDRIGVTIGDPQAWVPDDPAAWRRDKALQARAREVLAPCLVGRGGSIALDPGQESGSS